MTWRESAKRSGTKSLLRCVQTWWPTTRNVWPLWLPPSTKSCFAKGWNTYFDFFYCYSVSHCPNKPTIKIIDWSFIFQCTKSAGDQVIFSLTVHIYTYKYIFFFGGGGFSSRKAIHKERNSINIQSDICEIKKIYYEHQNLFWLNWKGMNQIKCKTLTDGLCSGLLKLDLRATVCAWRACQWKSWDAQGLRGIGAYHQR